MASAIFDVMVIDVAAANYLLRAQGQRLKFPGYLALSPDREESEFLPPVKEHDPLDLLNLQTEQHFTQPPARYTEATLVKAMESYGIGRPSTYAPIISTIIDRRYVFLEEKKFHPTGLGLVVTEQLEKHFPHIIDPEFTANMENQLDAVESGSEDWVKVLDEFYGPFEHALSEATETMQRIKVPEVLLEHTCPKCGKQLALREGRFGRFVACTGFPECDFTAQENDFVQKEDEGKEPGEKAEGGEEQPQVMCEQCGAPMTVRRSRRGPFLGCSKYPECTFTRPMPGEEAHGEEERAGAVDRYRLREVRQTDGHPQQPPREIPRLQRLPEMPQRQTHARRRSETLSGGNGDIQAEAPKAKKAAAAKRKASPAKSEATAKKKPATSRRKKSE